MYLSKDIQVVNEGTKYPFVVADNWYSPEEEKAVWSELDFYGYQEDIDRAENTIVAKFRDGTPKSHAYRWYITDYNPPNVSEKVSHISRYTYKLREQGFHDYIDKCKPYNRLFFSTNSDSTLISYYEEGDSYKAHHDSFSWTCLLWFSREPRIWTGGDLDFPESETQVNFKHNRAVFFPCCYLHRVSPIKFTEQPKRFGMGRYTITHFLFTIPKGNG